MSKFPSSFLICIHSLKARNVERKYLYYLFLWDHLLKRKWTELKSLCEVKVKILNPPHSFYRIGWIFHQNKANFVKRKGVFFGNTGYCELCVWGSGIVCIFTENAFLLKCCYLRLELFMLSCSSQLLSNHPTHSIESYNMQRLLFSWIKITNGHDKSSALYLLLYSNFYSGLAMMSSWW